MMDSLEDLINADPFHPFKIVLTSGDEYVVKNPLLIAVGKSELSFYYPKSDRRAHIRLNQIVAVETLHSSRGAA